MWGTILNIPNAGECHSTAGPPRVLYLAKRVVLSELQKSSPRPGGLIYFFKIPNSPSFLLSTMVGSPSAPVRYPPHRGKRKYLSWLVLSRSSLPVVFFRFLVVLDYKKTRENYENRPQKRATASQVLCSTSFCVCFYAPAASRVP